MLNKLSKKMWLFLIAFIAVAAGAYAFIILVVANVVPPGNCVETDAGLDFFSAGSISGSFQAPGMNATNNVTFTDVCASNTTVFEFVCGSSVSNNYRGLAALVWEDCNATGNATSCWNGRCI
tara:strand:- start:44115 stop:44480 length:366 start_codon:yes stop_codon:yes gene_type:complete